MDSELRRLVEQLAAQPWNRPGTDKTWVANVQMRWLRFLRDVRAARELRTWDLVTFLPAASYPELAKTAVQFSISGESVHVGALEALLEAKLRAGRPKDLQFIQAFRALRQTTDSPEPAGPPKLTKKRRRPK